MADETRTIIIDVEVEDKDFDQELGKVNTQLRANKEEIKELSRDYDNNATAIAKLDNENKDLVKSKQKLVKESKTESNSLNALRLRVANLTKERNNLDTSTKEGAIRFKELNVQIKANTGQLKEAEQAGGDFRRNVGNYSSELENAIPGLAGVRTGLVRATAAARAFIATPLGLILAGIALAVSAVAAAFKDSEEGQNKFNKLMGQIGVVLGNLRDLLADFGEGIIEAFENPQKAIENLGKLIRDNIVTRFEGLVNLIPNLGRAIQELFAGNFAEAGKIAVNALGQVTLGVESVTDSFNAATEAVSRFVAETEKEIGIAGKVADARAKADIIERGLLVERQRLEANIAELRLKSRQEEEFSAVQRGEFLRESLRIQDELLAKEQVALELRAFAQTEENKFARSTKENLDAEAQANANVIAIEVTRLNQARQVTRELNRINKEIERDNARLEKERQAASDLTFKTIRANAKKLADEEARLTARQVKNIQEAEKLKVASINQSFSDVANIFNQGSKIADAFALAGIARDTAQAIASLVAASEANPLNAVTFGGAGIAQFISGLVRITANIAQARKIIKGGGGGGETITASTSSGGGGGGESSTAISSGFAGVNAGLLSQFSQGPQNQSDSIAATVAAISNLPGGVVSVVDINTAQNKRSVKVRESQLGFDFITNRNV